MGEGVTLDALLDELTDLAASAPPTGEFFRAILEAAMNATDAKAGAIWSVVNANYRLEQEAGLVQLGIGSNRALQALHEDALQQASRESVPAPSEDARGLVEAALDRHRFRFFGCRDHRDAYLVIEIVHPVDVDLDIDGVARILAALSEIARDYRNAQTLQRLQVQDHVWSDFQSVLSHIHSSIELDEVAFQLANEGRPFLKCDRLSIAKIDSRSAHVIAVSGVTTLEPRAKQLRELEQLIAIVARSNSPLTYPSDIPDAPQRTDALQRYLDASGTAMLRIELLFGRPSRQDIDLPVRGPLEETSDRTCIGAMVIESFRPGLESDIEHRSRLLQHHGGLALQNALNLAQMPLRRLSQSIGAFPLLVRSYRSRVAWLCASMAILLLAAWLIPAELNIPANGTIQPRSLHHLYAPANGEIVSVPVSHQADVRAGDPVAIIRSREIELRKEELLTQRGASQEKLRGIEAARLRDRKTTSTESISNAELSANERELREVLSSQSAQLAILDEMIASLTLTSPIDGQVVSWNPNESLERRPVQQGQKLISIASLQGEGILHLRVLDADSRHLLRTVQQSQSPTKVTFSIASDPGSRHTAIVDHVGTILETVSDEGPTIGVDARVELSEMKNARPGATVIARIHCGSTSVGYVWVRRLWDYLRLHWT